VGSDKDLVAQAREPANLAGSHETTCSEETADVAVKGRDILRHAPLRLANEAGG